MRLLVAYVHWLACRPTKNPSDGAHWNRARNIQTDQPDG
jgi:hypothetical protein